MLVTRQNATINTMEHDPPKTHKITALSVQTRNPNRVNVSVDGKYRFSLDISQVADLGVKVGRCVTAAELAELEAESQFGKLYARTLEYCLARPHSVHEVRDYLQRKTVTRRYKSRLTGQIKECLGVDQSVADRILVRLREKGYVNDEAFARWWVENRNIIKGASKRKLSSELAAKGVDHALIKRILAESDRSDLQELTKIIIKKRYRYSDEQKFIAYLARQGFSYDDIKQALREIDN